MPQEWKEFIIVPVHKKGDRIDCNNYRGISLWSTSYKILLNILLLRMTPYANKIIGEYQCRFRRNRSTIDYIFSIRKILEKKWEYNNIMSLQAFNNTSEFLSIVLGYHLLNLHNPHKPISDGWHSYLVLI